MSNVEYKPAEKLQIRLVRPDPGASWGFRLQGGTDFSTPLSIQSVNPGSIAERCGLKPGDAILAINNATSDAMSHDEAKAEIVRSGDQIYMLVERGAVKIWKPQVTPLNELRPQELRTITSATGEDFQPIQKTSLAINKPPDEPCTIGSSHNRAAQPFGQPKVAVPNVVHAQYNSPMGLYSANNIADSFSKQTAGIQSQIQSLDISDQPLGARMSGTYQSLDPSQMGQSPFGSSYNAPQQQQDINDPTPEETNSVKPRQVSDEPSNPVEEHQGSARAVQPSPPLTNDSTAASVATKSTESANSSASGKTSSATQPSRSAVYEEQKGETPEYRGYTNPSIQSRTFKHLQEQLEAEENNNNNSGGFRSVSAPVAKPPSERPQQPSMRCGGCDMLATGVIVKANGVPYHVACFKCTSCSLNLKQKGFFVVEGKLYCETHAKFHAKPPGPDMVAVPMYR